MKRYEGTLPQLVIAELDVWFVVYIPMNLIRGKPADKISYSSLDIALHFLYFLSLSYRLPSQFSGRLNP